MAKPETKIGCCGAYCKTCRELIGKNCRGCKLGYETGARDINRAKCKIKLCCFRDRNLETCADCSDYGSCKILNDWYSKGYKYSKYKQSIEFIRNKGYAKFIKAAAKWRGPYGKIHKEV